MTVATIALPLSAPFDLHLPGAHQQHRVAVDDRPVRVDEDRAVAIAVERDTDRAVPRDHAGERLGMRRSTIEVDVPTVRVTPMQLTSNPARGTAAARRWSSRRWRSRSQCAAVRALRLAACAQVSEIGVDDVGTVDAASADRERSTTGR